jgi:hypothetical protein
MNKVAPDRLPTALSCSTSAAGTWRDALAPRKLWTLGRDRSVGRSSSSGRPDSCFDQ